MENEFSGLEINKCLIYSRDESSIGGKYDKTVTIEKSVVKELKVLSQKHQITYFELLISVYNILIHRLSREKDIVIGFPYANRSDKTNNILGFFPQQLQKLVILIIMILLLVILLLRLQR